MIDVSFEINGRKISPKQVGNALERTILESVKDEIMRKAGAFRDPATGERPRITVKGRSLDKLSFEVSGSKQMVERVKQALR